MTAVEAPACLGLLLESAVPLLLARQDSVKLAGLEPLVDSEPPEGFAPPEGFVELVSSAAPADFAKTDGPDSIGVVARCFVAQCFAAL